MTNNKALIPAEQKSVEFYGDDLTAVHTNNSRIYPSLNARGQTKVYDCILMDTQLYIKGRGSCFAIKGSHSL